MTIRQWPLGLGLQRWAAGWDSNRLARWFSAAILAALFVSQLWVVRLPLLDHTGNDDAYYYFEVAQRAAHGQGFTFDGLTPTNGFQPAWQLTLTALALAVPDKENFVRAALLLCILLNGFSGIMLYRLWTEHSPVVWAPILLALWGSIQLDPSLALSGMETHLNLAIFVSARWYVARLPGPAGGAAARNGPWRTAAVVGLLAGLLVLARIDNVIFAGFLALAALLALANPWTTWRAAWGVSWRPLAAVALVAGLLLIPYLAWNILAFGSLLPVSGVFKQHYNTLLVIDPHGGYASPRFLAYALARLGDKLEWAWAIVFSIFGAGTPLFVIRPSGVLAISAGLVAAAWLGAFVGQRSRQSPARPSQYGRLAWQAGLVLLPFWVAYGLAGRYLAGLDLLDRAAKLGLLLLAAVGVFLIGFRGRVGPAPAARVFTPRRWLAVCLLLAVLVHGLAIVLVADYFLDYTSWYFATWFVLIALFSVWSLYQLGQQVLPKRLQRGYLSLLTLLSIVGLAATGLAQLATLQRPLAPPYSQKVTAYEIARGLAETTPPETHLAAYNAGVLGYFSNRSTTNLDGLVNNQALLPYLFGPETMTDYLDKLCPDYLIDFVLGSFPSGTLPQGALILKINRDRLAPIAWTPTRGWLDAPQTYLTFKVIPAATCA